MTEAHSISAEITVNVNCLLHSTLENVSSKDSDSNISSKSVSGEIESKNEEDFGVVGGLVEPYRFEPVAPEGYEEPDEEDDDGLTLAILEARADNQTTLDTW